LLTAISNLGFILTALTLFLIVFIFIVVMRMKRKAQIHYAFAVLMGTTFFWALGAAILEYNSLNGRPTQIWAVNLAYFGLIMTPLAVLFLGLIFAKTKIRLSWIYGFLFIVPVTSLVMLLTNDMHHLFYRTIEYESLTWSSTLGSYFIIHSIYSYLCITVGMGYLVFFSIKNAGFFSRQSILIFIGIIISTTYNFLLTIQVIHVLFHTNVLAFFFPLLLFYFAIIKYDFLNLVPIALQNVVDHISDSFIIIDKNLTIIDFNKTFRDEFGSDLKVNRKANLADIMARPDTSAEMAGLLGRFKEAADKQVPMTFETSLVLQNNDKHFSVEITPLINNGLYFYTIILMKDVTQLKHAADLIQKNAEILMEKERLASLGQMIGGIAHNLKTPIMSISGGIEGLKELIEEYDNSIGDEQVTLEDHHAIAHDMLAWIEKIKPHCSYMSDIITTVKGQAAQFNIIGERSFKLEELIKRVDLLMKHELRRYHCDLKISYDADPSTEINGDINSLVQIMDNLIINSIHAYEGKTGIIELNIKSAGPNIELSLKDYGKGIPLAIQEKLFKEMVTTKGKGGTGLGLYMSNSTIKARLGGSMSFISEPGQGTTFTISIPLTLNPELQPE
jgi:two-component system, NtrC family, sensor histidine kinase HupT/HoxJ